jgi:N-acetylglucosaminyl-diphospho-decaprenol L-rhamnosyltransferase
MAREAGSDGPAVTVAVVSWNNRDLLLRCLRSLAPDAEAGLADVWVVDNGSSDASADATRRDAPWAHVIETGENLGFGRAVNLVAGETNSEWVAPANADVALERGALETLLEAGADPSVGCIAPRLITPTGETQHSVYPFPGVGFTLLFNLGLHKVSGRLADRLCLEGAWNPERARSVPWAVGAFLCIRRAAFDEVGGFDPERWLYAEDLDIGWRLNRRGWVTRYEPLARVLHEEGAATTPVFGEEKTERFTAATYSTIRRVLGPGRARLIGWMNVSGAALRLVWLEPLAVASPRWRHRRDTTRRWLGAHLRGRKASQPLPSRT